MVDVYLLGDATGSMDANIYNELMLNIGNIATQLGAGGCDVAYGVGRYKDFGSDISLPSDVFTNLQDPTANLTDVTNALTALAGSVTGGDDYPEGQFYAFDQITNGGVVWRSGARKIIVWIGDAPAHDPICAAMTGLGYDITEATTTTALVSKGIRVFALNVGASGGGLDDDPLLGNASYAPWGCTQIGSGPGQATRIAGATGGSIIDLVDATNIVANVINLVSWALTSYVSVSLVPTGGTAPFVTAISPSSYGPLGLGSPYDLPFDVLFTGVVPCIDDVTQVFNGTINVVVDGAVVAQKTVEIKVPPCPPDPSVPKSPCDDAANAANNELSAMLNDKEFFMTATPACANPSDPADISKACNPLALPDVRPCFFIKWGDGSRDQIETEDFEVLLLTVCNPYSNLSFGHLLIPKIEVTDALGNPIPLLPDGTESVMIVPSRMICFDEIPPCSCRSFELALKTVGAKEDFYKLKFSYCLDVCFTTGPNEQEFEFELITS
jgi:hypothetical protein